MTALLTHHDLPAWLSVLATDVADTPLRGSRWRAQNHVRSQGEALLKLSLLR